MQRTENIKRLIYSRLISENVLALLLQYLGLTLCTLTATPSPVWFATGTASALLFMRGPYVLPGLFLGGFIAYQSAHAPPFISLTSAMILTLEPLAIYALCLRYLSPTMLFVSQRSSLLFVLLSAFVSGVASTSLALIADIPARWLTWWFANLNGVWIVGTAIVALDYYFPDIDRLKHLHHPIYYLAVTLLFTEFTYLICSSNTLAITFLTLLITAQSLLIRYYLGWCGQVGASFCFAFIITLANYLQAPLFSTDAIENHTWILSISLLLLAIFLYWPSSNKNPHLSVR